MNISQNQYGTRVGYYPEYAGNRAGSRTEKEENKDFVNSLEEERKEAAGNVEDSGSTKGEEQDKTEEEKSYREQILEKMEEMAQNIRKGTIQPKFKIGAQEYTIKEWEKLLEKFDAAEEALREAVEEQIEEIRKQAEMEALRREAQSGMHDPKKATYVSETTATYHAPDVTGVPAQPAAEAAGTDIAETDGIGDAEAAALLTDEITKCSYPTDDPEHKHWYITCYGQDGISCKEAYYDGTRWVNKDLWSLKYTEKGQYEKVMAFLQRFPQDANLRFAAHENFWKDFLADKINEDEFAAFFETTKDGVPDYTYEKDGSTYIDKDKLKFAQYMNGFGVRMYTREEMELILRGILHENRKKLTPMSDEGGRMTVPRETGGKWEAEEEDEVETKLVTKPDGSTVLQIKTAYGVMELEVTQAQKFGLLVDVGRNSVGAGDI